jgi:hypothetical protein
MRGKKMQKAILLFCLSAITVVAPSLCSADDSVQIIDVLPDQSSDVYFFINLKGKLYLKIAAEGDNKPCAEFWWIKWGFGTIETIGQRCNEFVLDIPEASIADPVISGKLRTSGAHYRLKIGVSADEGVAHDLSLSFN